MKNQLLSMLVLPALLAATPVTVRAADADNSANNANDRNGQAVTAQCQSNEKEDVAVTRAIRRAVVKDSSLSVYAHNIKIITTKSHEVYLRGAVASTDDVDKLVALAQQNATGYSVKNEISVSSK